MITLIFVILKVTHTIDISWWWAILTLILDNDGY